MAQALLIRRLRLRATHRYGHHEASAEENRRRFGAQCEVHEHDWTFEFHVVGTIDPDTGWCADLGEVDDAIGGVIGAWEGGHLNDLVPAVREGRVQPSCEELARWLHGAVGSALEGAARLVHVSVFESAELGASFPAP